MMRSPHSGYIGKSGNSTVVGNCGVAFLRTSILCVWLTIGQEANTHSSDGSSCQGCFQAACLFGKQGYGLCI